MRRWRNLTTRLSLLVALAVMLVLLVVGVYFDFFLRNSFEQATAERMQHAYQRLESSLAQIEQELINGAHFAKTDERLIASMELINHYENRERYNTFLIDEEKITLAQELLGRVKLSFNDDISLYGDREDLIAFVGRDGDRYRLGYVTYAQRQHEVKTRAEGQPEFKQGALPESIVLDHALYANENQADPEPLLTYHRLNSALVVKVHQNVIDRRDGHYIGHLELSHILDAGYFDGLSKDLDLKLVLAFGGSEVPVWSELKALKGQGNLLPHLLGDRYVSAVQLPVVGGQAFVQASLESRSHMGLLNTHRTRFLLLQVLLAAVVLWAARLFIVRTLTRPLGLLMDQIHSIERGDYGVKQQLRTGDELQQISSSINQLATTVRDRQASLEQARYEQEFLSNHDALTGLPNRRFFSHRLEHALDVAQRQHTELAVLFMDLDQFKLINDTLGHGVGDMLLMAVAHRMRGQVRQADTLARIGGDEFNVLIENVQTPEHLETLVGKLLELFREPFVCGEHIINATVSIGISIYPRDGTDSVSLLKHADLAVYQSKESGRDNYSFFSQEMSQRVRHRADLIHALNQAIESGDQFALVYQPKVGARTGRVESAEALIRWQSPQFGAVSPVQFIPLAEETGQILDIGAWVIQQACHDLAVMRAAHLELNHLSVNVSGVQLKGKALGSVMEKALQAHGLRPEWLEMEITESFIARDTHQAISTLDAFRATGMQLAIDDFGTGYSSMSYLHKLPFTRVKIDKSFIDGLPHNHDSVSITRAILSLAKNFGLSTTAEGVEHSEQLLFLQQEGCDEIQGYFYSRPLPLPDFLAFCQKNLASTASA
jgi:diguanylate cyclase (GGDEF)-like protein